MGGHPVSRDAASVRGSAATSCALGSRAISELLKVMPCDGSMGPESSLLWFQEGQLQTDHIPLSLRIPLTCYRPGTENGPAAAILGAVP